MTLDYVSDWAARLRSRLYTQFRGKVTWEQWVQLLGRQFQDLEDSAQTLLALLDIDSGVGVQLDVIGRIVGRPRNGVDDTTYRLYLKARVLANRSTGTPEDLYAVIRALFALPMIYTQGLYKEFTLRVKSAITAGQAIVGASFLGVAAEAGARGLFEWQEYVDASMFYTQTPIAIADVNLTQTISAAGATTLYMGQTTVWTDPLSGYMLVGYGASDEEWLGFSGVSYNGVQLEVYLTSPATQAHPNHSAVYLMRGDGLGFGDANDASVGGYLASAVQS